MSKQNSCESALDEVAGSAIPFRLPREAACENCGGVATKITEDGIKLCQACYALCPEDDSAQNKPSGEPPTGRL